LIKTEKQNDQSEIPKNCFGRKKRMFRTDRYDMIFMRFTVFHFSLCRAGGWMEASSNMTEDFSILKNPSYSLIGTARI
jgi:hypothetical protein